MDTNRHGLTLQEVHDLNRGVPTFTNKFYLNLKKIKVTSPSIRQFSFYPKKKIALQEKEETITRNCHKQNEVKQTHKGSPSKRTLRRSLNIC